MTHSRAAWTMRRRESGWVNRADMRRVLDLSEQALDRARASFPTDGVRKNSRGALAFYARDCCVAWVLARYAGGDGDNLLGGSGSPALEAFRRERARLAKLDRLEREGALIRRTDVRYGLDRLAALLRSFAERLRTRHGQEAAALLDDVLSTFDRELVDHFRQPAQDADHASNGRNTHAASAEAPAPRTRKRRPSRHRSKAAEPTSPPPNPSTEPAA